MNLLAFKKKKTCYIMFWFIFISILLLEHYSYEPSCFQEKEKTSFMFYFIFISILLLEHAHYEPSHFQKKENMLYYVLVLLYSF